MSDGRCPVVTSVLGFEDHPYAVLTDVSSELPMGTSRLPDHLPHSCENPLPSA